MIDMSVTELWSDALGGAGTVIRYGHWGRPLLVFPSEQGRAWDFESNGMTSAISGLIEAGRVKVYCVDSYDGMSWSNRGVPLEERARQHGRYESWIIDQVVPWIQQDCGGARVQFFDGGETRKPERFPRDHNGKRQRRGAITVAHLAARNQDPCASLVLLLDNAPISRYDPWSWRLRKVAKTLVASPTVLAAADLLTRRLERQAPESPRLRRIYWSMIGACIFGGIREGLAQRPEVRDVAAGAMRGRFVSA